MTEFRNVIAGISKSRNIYADVFIPDSDNFEMVVFFHGTKGFKDWGAWHLMSPYFTHENLGLVTVNFSHNGISKPGSDEMNDTPAFASNTISLELAEMKMVIDWLDSKQEEWGHRAVYHIIGHSRAGAEVIVYANRDSRIDKVIAWAPINDFLQIFGQIDPEKWKEEGSVSLKNTRTGQTLPVNYTYYSDIQKNADEFDVLKSASLLTQPLLLIHGTDDTSVPLSNSEKIYEQCLHSLFVPVEGANHTFNTSHPWTEGSQLPKQFLLALENTVDFITG